MLSSLRNLELVFLRSICLTCSSCTSVSSLIICQEKSYISDCRNSSYITALINQYSSSVSGPSILCWFICCAKVEAHGYERIHGRFRKLNNPWKSHDGPSLLNNYHPVPLFTH